MDIPVNQFKRALKDGKPQIGMWSSLSSHIVAEILAHAGFDWVLLDTEHSPNELPMVQSQLHAMTGGTATPVVRPAWNDMVLIKRFLDIGAQSLLLPYVQSAEEAQNAVRYTRYPQQGLRGVAGATRAAGYGRTKDYLKRAHERNFVRHLRAARVAGGPRRRPARAGARRRLDRARRGGTQA